MKNELGKGQDLESLWDQMAQEKFGQHKLEKQNIMNALKQKSTLDIDQLRTRLGIKLLWCLAFVVAFILMMLFNLQNTVFLQLMGMATLLYVLVGLMMYKEYRKMNRSEGMDDSVLNLMKHNLKAIKSALRLERVWGMFVFPLAVPFGILIPHTLKGMTIKETIQDHQMMWLALIGMVIVVPIIAYLSDRMTKVAFGEEIKSLEENIIKMETLI